jgi:hypothetical protein
MAAKKESDSTDTTPKAAPPKLTQREAVQKAIAAGKELPKEGTEYIASELGMTLTKMVFSTLKSKLKREASQAKKPRIAAPSTNGTSPHKPASVATPASNPAELARQVKALVGLYGADAVKGMVDVFAE